MTRLNIDPNLYPNMLISLTEAVNNAMQHGNQFDDHKQIMVSYRKRGHQIRLTISDEGSGFDPVKIPDPTSSDHVEVEGGRGVFLMKQLTDELHFLDHGRTVELMWKI
ncbi:MAG TPA: ATP-binding protein [Saprospiraceae bacterium]|nr:ATP-binding protein [Saprospiraceae bacterium]